MGVTFAVVYGWKKIPIRLLCYFSWRLDGESYNYYYYGKEGRGAETAQSPRFHG